MFTQLAESAPLPLPGPAAAAVIDEEGERCE